MIILLIYPEMVIEQLGEYGHRMIQTFSDADKTNPYLEFRMKDMILFNESEVFM